MPLQIGHPPIQNLENGRKDILADHFFNLPYDDIAPVSSAAATLDTWMTILVKISHEISRNFVEVCLQRNLT